MDLKRVIERVYDINLPIGGGLGESLDDAVVLQAVAASNYISLEYKVLDYLADLENYKYEVLTQCLLNKGPSVFDRITVKFICTMAGEEIIKHYYFDISQCFKHQPMSLIRRK